MSNGPLTTYAEVVGEFKSYTLLARELTALGYPVTDQAVRLWAHRDNIPPGYWKGLLDLARRHGLDRIRSMVLINIAAQKIEGRGTRPSQQSTREEPTHDNGQHEADRPRG